MPMPKRASVEDFFEQLDDRQRPHLEQLRALSLEADPAAEEKLAWNLPVYVRDGKTRLWMLQNFKNHCSLRFPPRFFASRRAEVQDAGYEAGEGFIKLPYDAGIPVELCRSLMRARIGEYEATGAGWSEDSSRSPSPGALAEVRRLAGPAAAILAVTRLEGGQHADTWRVDLADPSLSVVVRQFPRGDPGAAEEQRALQAIDGLGGLAPRLLGGDLDGRWSEHPASLISCLDGQPDITPGDPERWARELGRGLAVVHALPRERLASLPSVFDRRGSETGLGGPLAEGVSSSWPQIAGSPAVLVHSDYWSGNVVFRDGTADGHRRLDGRGARAPRL